LWAARRADWKADQRVVKMVAWKADLSVVLKVDCWVDRKEEQTVELKELQRADQLA
jgi:hypothetical protein